MASGRLQPEIESALLDAGVPTRRKDGLLRPQLRASRVHSQMFLHSAYPTIAPDCVFLGPGGYLYGAQKVGVSAKA